MSTPTSIHRMILLFVLILLLVSGCLFVSQPVSEEPAPVDGAPAESEPELARSPAVVGEAAGSELSVSGEEKAVVEVEVAEEAPAMSLELIPESEERPEGREEAGDRPAIVEATPLPAATAGPVDEAEAEDSPARLDRQQSEPLRAGEVDDNAHWDDYLLYRRNYRGPQVHERDVTERYIIEVEDAQGHPVLGATVRIFLPDQQQRQEIYQARTYANGRVLFHPLALTDLSMEQVERFLVEVEQGNLLEQFTLIRFEAQASNSFTERWTVTLDTRLQFDSLDLDVLFLIDATGSMADEIAKVRDTIFDVAARIDGLPGRPNVRYGMVTYRDREDEFVTRTYEFTPDVGDFHRNLGTVVADGGGDTPESLNEGLHRALHGVEWRGSDTVQLIFLIADAPPHLDYPQDYDYAVEMENAAGRGIKIFPIASSGLDDQGEYIFRQIAQYTQGRFIFLTYEGPTNRGSPGDTTTHHVEDYTVANLDDLLVKLVEEELAYQTAQVVQGQ